MIDEKKYRKKPVEVEAVQWFKDGDHFKVVPIPEKCKDFNPVVGGATGYIDTLRGGHFVTVGDWIIKGAQGEFYPCKPDIFQKTYEPAEALFKGDEEGLLTPEDIGNLEWDSTDLEMYYYEQFAEAHPKEAKAILKAQQLFTKRLERAKTIKEVIAYLENEIATQDERTAGEPELKAHLNAVEEVVLRTVINALEEWLESHYTKEK